jgi:hypothetical protein
MERWRQRRRTFTYRAALEYLQLYGSPGVITTTLQLH